MVLKIYLCAFLKKEYVEEARVCIESIRTKGLFTGPIYLFTDMNVEIEGVIILKATCTSVPLAASYRTRLFDHIHDFSKDDVVLYLDTDIIVMKPLPTFDTIGDKIQVYSYTDKTQEHEHFCGFITDDRNYIRKPAICSGILLFRPTDKIRNLFDETYELYQQLIKRQKINACWEQPALCFKLIEHDLYTISLNDLVHEERWEKKIEDSVIFNHFCGLRALDRYKKMKKCLDPEIKPEITKKNIQKDIVNDIEKFQTRKTNGTRASLLLRK
jgi:hypothetical protein